MTILGTLMVIALVFVVLILAGAAVFIASLFLPDPNDAAYEERDDEGTNNG